MKTFFDYSLTSLNTFGIDSIAATFVILENIDDIRIALEQFGKPQYILGGGSNVIMPTYIDGTVWHPNFSDTQYIQENNNILYTIGAGQNWHNTVLHTISKGWWGIENLIAIPGNVGASPVQNIGAYGVELQDVFVGCTVYNFETNSIENVSKNNCHFGYRHSIFKENPGKYLVIDITLKLSLIPHAVVTYKPIQEYFTTKGITPTQSEIGAAIEEIRWSKLPRPEILGNCGSFFQNPIVSKEKINELLLKYPTMPHYIQENGTYKISAAWLIENAGLKGYRQGNIGTYEKQPLVIVQYGDCKKEDVLSFSNIIIDKINSLFGVQLQREVNIW